MTTEALDLLDQLSNPTNIKQAAQDRDRPQDRFPATHFRADILGNGADLEVTQRTPQGSRFPQHGVWLDIDVLEILGGKGTLGEQKLWIRGPGPRQDGTQQASDRTEMGQMMLAVNNSDASITSIRQLPGRKNVEFIEATDDYLGSQRDDTTGVWNNAVPRSTWFYKLNFRSGGAVANGNTSTAAAKPSDAAIAKALDMIKSAGTDGIREAEFNLAASKDSVIKADKAMLGYLHSGKLVGDNPDKVLRDGEKLVWVASE